MSKSNRLFLILSLLRSRKDLTASDLADQCEVSERTIHRDIQALSDFGVPIHFDRGYKLPGDAFLPPLNFTVDELLSMYIGLSSNTVQSIDGLRKSARQALSKLESSIPERIKVDYEEARKRITVRPERTRSHQGVALILELLRQGRWPDKKIRLNYVSPQSSEIVELIPKDLLYKQGNWYLTGLIKKEIRYFRLDMIRDFNLS